MKIIALPTPVTILVIDDEPSILRGLALLLRRDGYQVATAANGHHALAQLQAQPYHVILSDLRMPHLDGHALYTLLQQQYPALCPRVIFLTGNGDEADSHVFLTQCGQPWLRKPCPIAMLRRTIQQVLAAAVASPYRRNAFVLADSIRTNRPSFHRVHLGVPQLLRLRELSRAEEKLLADFRRQANRLRD